MENVPHVLLVHPKMSPIILPQENFEECFNVDKKNHASFKPDLWSGPYGQMMNEDTYICSYELHHARSSVRTGKCNYNIIAIYYLDWQ